MYRKLILAALCLTFVTVIAGAYVRLQDAGLGCPDWPGCYGHWIGVPDQAHEIERAAQAFPGKTVEAGKAWKEMLHRYVAGALGLLLLAVMAIAWRRRGELRQSPALPTAIVAVVGLQAALGMWTVTMLLRPVIVTLHLLGGMTTLALLSWLALRQLALPARRDRQHGLRAWAALAMTVVFVQIALGGWVSANYAALACLDFPTCQGAWLPAMDFSHGFHLTRELGLTAGGAPLGLEALAAIHWTHRVGALVTLLVVGGLALVLMRTPALARHGVALALVLLLQIGLGIANVVLKLPLPVAVAHNAAAAGLLVTLVVINFALSRSRDS
jgi:cytochrome c oxidase assembly protein subunit 15